MRLINQLYAEFNVFNGNFKNATDIFQSVVGHARTYWQKDIEYQGFNPMDNVVSVVFDFMERRQS